MKQKHIYLFAVCIDLKWIFIFEIIFFFLAKPKVEGKVNDVTVQINEPAELRTKFSAIPKPTVTWFVFFYVHLFHNSNYIIFSFSLGIKKMI